MKVQTTEAVMPLLENVMKALKSSGKAMPVTAPHTHDSDEIFLADAETRRRDCDLAILRSLCS
jgi:hypothetical protein